MFERADGSAAIRRWCPRGPEAGAFASAGDGAIVRVGMMGIGLGELVIVVLIGFMVIALPVAVVVALVLLFRKKAGSGRGARPRAREP